MTLIKSISGIRGTIGGKPGENLTPLDITKFVAAYSQLIRTKRENKKLRIVLGRDARISGPMVAQIVIGTLQGMGLDVIDLGMASTPTTEIAVTELNADGGIILTASHNPGQWNALKLLNEKGEFISAEEGRELLHLVETEDYSFIPVEELGTLTTASVDDIHIEKILQLNFVDVEAIRNAEFKVAIDCVNSVGGIIIPKLLKALGVKEIIELYCDPTGYFPHNPEPLPEHLGDLSKTIQEHEADIGFTVDPDVDRLAILNEDGTMFGEEYTLVAVADYILGLRVGNTVSNLSSTRALRDITEQYGGSYAASAVGEVNVVEMMKETNAIIGGEGNGGVILPELHYGRDALVGIALFLTHLAKSGKTCSELRQSYPAYVISKNKIELDVTTNVDMILEQISEIYKEYPVNKADGVKVEFNNGWVHLRKSNTEPIIRIYAENKDKQSADVLAQKIMNEIKKIS